MNVVKTKDLYVRMDIGWGDKYIVTLKSVVCSKVCYVGKKKKTFKQNEAVKFSNQLCFGKSISLELLTWVLAYS
jgi:hypothetical protein